MRAAKPPEGPRLFRLGYNTNGLAHHRLLDALRMVADLGYEGLAVTLDVGHLDPYDLRPGEASDLARWAEDLGVELAVETGSRFLLDAQRKHFPTLLEEGAGDRNRRVDYLKRAVDLAQELGAPVVSLWAGAAPDGSTGDGGEGPQEIWDRLCSGLAEVLVHAAPRGVNIAFEPEPGMFIERPSGYGALIERLGSQGGTLGLCLDVGHCLVTGDLPVPEVIRAWAPRLIHVHLDDIANGVHDHRMFGTGDLDLAGTLSALAEVGYDGMAAVELSRDSHRGAQAAAEAWQHLREALGGSMGSSAKLP